MTDDKKKKATKDMSESELKELLKECQLSLNPHIEKHVINLEQTKKDIDIRSDFIDESDFSKAPDHGLSHYRALRQLMTDVKLEEEALAIMMKAKNCETYEEYIGLSQELIYKLSEVRGNIEDEETMEQDKAKDLAYGCGFFDGRLATYKHLKKRFLEPK